MLGGVLVYLDADPEVDLVEADVSYRILATGGPAHRKERTLRHGRHYVRRDIALRPRADSPRARRVVLLEQVLDRIPIGDYGARR